jgi:NAD+ synthase
MDDYDFDADKILEDAVDWIQDYFEVNSGGGQNAVVGMSGGKDSAVVAALCMRALGTEHVIGVIMPNGYQEDYIDAVNICRYLELPYMTIDVGRAVNALAGGCTDSLYCLRCQMGLNEYGLSKLSLDFTDSELNMPSRLRMATLMYVAQAIPGGRVACTCNLSENWVGYSTLFGDAIGQFSVLEYLTATEVIALGKALGLPDWILRKAPSDGLSDMTDEEKLGVTYRALDTLLREGTGTEDDIAHIRDLHDKNYFKQQYSLGMPSYKPDIPLAARVFMP